ERLRRHYPRLIVCSVSGYGDTGPYAARKAYDMLIQAEAGIASVTGGPEAPARVGVSVCDIGAGMNAYEAVLEALIARGRTGKGGAAFGALDVEALVEKLAAADIAFGRVNGPGELARHPHLRRITIGSPGGLLSYPAPAAQWAGEARNYGPVPGIGEHSEKIR